MIRAPVFSSGSSRASASRPAWAFSSATPPPGTTPSSSAGRLQRVLDAVLFLLHLGLRGGADLDDRNASGELRQTLLEFFPIEVGVGVLDLLFDLLDPAFDVVSLAGTIDDRGVVFGD